MMLKRWLTGLFLAAIVFAVVWFGDPAFSIFIAVIAFLGACEFFPLIGVPRKHPVTIFGVIGVLLFIGLAQFEMKYTAQLLTAMVILPLIWLVFQRDIKHAAVNWAWLIVGILYLGWMLSHFVQLRLIENTGRDLVLLAVIGNIASDTIAFQCGLKWGRHRMAPNISPAKSWEGAIAGFLGAVAVVIILGTFLPTLNLPYWQSAVLGVLIGIFAPLGDLAESLLKRSTGVKDSGNCVPGHGGMLDRLDSMLFTVVVVYYFVTWVIV
jgi:phosphatidate cytidylyltransferase